MSTFSKGFAPVRPASNPSMGQAVVTVNTAEARSPEAGSTARTRCRIGVAESGTVKFAENDPSPAAVVSPTGAKSNEI